MAPTNGKNLVPEFRVLVNGNELPPEAVIDLITVAVHEDLMAPGMFTLTLVNWDMARLQVTWADDDLFAVGSEVEVQMGYVDAQKTLIIGEITGLEPEFCPIAPPTITVRGYDRRHRLMRDYQTKTFAQMKDSDIARQLASDYGLQAEVEDTGTTLDYVLQHNQTPWAFLQTRAQRNGYEVVVADKTLYFRPHQPADTEALSLKWEVDLIEFYPRLSTLSQAGQVRVRGWNPTDKAEIIGQAGAGDEGTTMGGTTGGARAVEDAFGQTCLVSVDRPVLSQAEADQLALGRFRTLALGYLSGDGVCIGRTDLRAGTVIQVEGIGERFSGLYYVSSTIHRFDTQQGIYRTQFTIGRNAT
jgi:phage protein D